MLPPGLLDTLPVGAVVPDLLDALERSGTAVLQAPPGTGKTTLVPLALAGALPGRVLVAEPRRVAARAAAARMAALLGEEVGGTVGYAVRGERRAGPGTRVEVVTTGLLLRRLLSAEDLPGVSAVLLDEVHERQVELDLAMAFCLQARRLLREDLRIVAASATLAADRLAALLGDGPGTPAPVVRATAPVHPLHVRWCPPPRPVRPPEGLRVDPALLEHVAALVREAVAELDGDVLVFLPGAGEIAAVQRRLALPGVDVAVLTGGLGSREQDAALRPGPRRRVVLATAVAESSLTVPGVRVVVDSGLARVPRVDHARGLAGLDTVRVSRAGAEQRAGRAAREAPGTVLRAWSPADHALLVPEPAPGIATSDLTAFALLAACWGEVADLPLLDRPPAGPLAAARQVLRDLGLLDAAGAVTPAGRAAAEVGAHPRLARALLDGAPLVGAARAAEVVALVGEDVRGRDDDLVATWRAARAGRAPGAEQWRREARRLCASLPARSAATSPDGSPGDLPDDLAAGLVTALAFPERIALRRGAGWASTGGTRFEAGPGSALEGATWLAVAVADRAPGRASARVRAAAPLDEDLARTVVTPVAVDEVAWRDGDVVARRVERLGELELSTRPLADPPPERVAAAVADGLRREGLGVLRLDGAVRSLRQRVACCRAALGEPWPDWSDEALAADPARWLGPQLTRVRSRADLRRLDAGGALRRALPWEVAARLDELAPEALAVPSGRRVALDYADPAAPVLSLKLQEAFGWRTGPRVAGGRVAVVVHLLSPAGRPLAVTADLESFWRNGYPGVRSENRGRYPKHPWPEDPLAAEPTARTSAALRRGTPPR
ncbi:ATP-dependent helicase HrpB [Kineococcus auxinigenes]|uniref:ATP-dependent helicase HrpB n=1 Tax=unclassified Kineococcus TaxID=2621656 RepID=UPI003D7E73B2